MTSVNAHSVVHHGVLNLVDDGGSGSLNTQGPLNLEKYTEKPVKFKHWPDTESPAVNKASTWQLQSLQVKVILCSTVEVQD